VAPRSRVLVVTANYELAKRALQDLAPYKGRYGLKCDIATSHDDFKATRNIKAFRAGRLDVLVTIAMAYEGMDVPEASHVICLTNIRSAPWIEQMVSRAARVDRSIPYEVQAGHIFCPDDPLMREIVNKIKTQQSPFLEKRVPAEQAGLFVDEEGDGEGSARSKITPIGSQLTIDQQHTIGHTNQPWCAPRPPSEIEADLRQRIESMVRRYTLNKGLEPWRLNKHLKDRFGKRRDAMTMPELENVMHYLKTEYPNTMIRKGKRTWVVR
jgi:hypothetical protein